MPISPIGGITVPTAASFQPPTSVGAPDATTGAGAVDGASGSGLGNIFTDSLNNAASAQQTSDALVQQSATGTLQNLTSVMTAMTEAQLSTQLTVALRNKAVESFNEIMRMQL